MQSVRTPNYRLISDYSISVGLSESKTIPGGSFVRPIKTCYLPQHVLDDSRWKAYLTPRYIFCHTKYGTIPIPLNLLEEA